MPSELDDLYTPILPFSAWISAVAGFGRFERALAEYERARAAATDDVVSAAVTAVFDAAALETGAIEGLYVSNEGITLSVVEGVMSLAEAIAESPGSTVERLVTGQRAAYDIAREVVSGDLPITEVLIRQIHEQACEGQGTYWVTTATGRQEQDLPKGTYKLHPNHVLLKDGTTHAYAPVDQVGPEMHRLIEEVRTPEFESGSPVLRSAYLHHALTHIHPFADGNGRTARVVGSLPLVAATGLPLIVFADRLPAYRRAQAAADVGAVVGFLEFVELAMVDLLTILMLRVERGIVDLQALEESIARERADKTLYAAVDRLASILDDAIGHALEGAITESPSETRTFRWLESGGRAAQRGEYTQATKWRGMSLGDQAHTDLSVSSLVTVFVSRSIDLDDGLALGNDDKRILPIRLDEISPRPTHAVRAKVREWMGGEVDRLSAELAMKRRA